MSQSLFGKLMLTVILGAPLLAVFYGVYSLVGDVPSITTVRWHGDTHFAFPAFGMETRLWDIFFLPIIAAVCVWETASARLKERESDGSHLFAGTVVCMSASMLITFATGPYIALMFGLAIGIISPILAGFGFGLGCMKGFAVGASVGVALYTGGIVGAVLLVGCGIIILAITLIFEFLAYLSVQMRKHPLRSKTQ